MKYTNLIGEFMAEFPELKNISKIELDRWKGEEPPVHVFFGYVFIPVMKKELVTMKNRALLTKMFDFLEKMSNSPDEHVQEVAGVSIIESLIGEKKLLQKARLFMGNSTLKMSYEIENWVPDKENLAKFNEYKNNPRKPPYL